MKYLHRQGGRPLSLVPESILPAVKRFHSHLRAESHSFLLADQVQQRLEEFLGLDPALTTEAVASLRKLYRGTQEMVLYRHWTYILQRPRIAMQRIVRLDPDAQAFAEVSRAEYLHIKDSYAQGEDKASRRGLVLNFTPYFSEFPKVSDPKELGEGISFLNRQLSGQVYRDRAGFGEALLKFLRGARLDGQSLLVNETVRTTEELTESLDSVLTDLSDVDPATSHEEVGATLRRNGLDAGWGNTVGRIQETLTMLRQLLQSPDPSRMENLLERLPMNRHVLLVSPHGWFAQEGVLGKPDTGGQVVYVLDQARALERRMKEHFEACGVALEPHLIILTRLIPDAEGTTCDVPKEKVYGSDNCWIVRVPFRDRSGKVVREWISRFKIWPFLEQFAMEAKEVIIAEFRGHPDLILGNYSDGNLVAYLLADEMGVSHCAMAHALEKSKYLFSDMRWSEMENDYHWSLQFTADIIAYNSADFIITSTYREIGGSALEMGMFESYETFSMPGLYRVLSGMDPKLARYNIVPPGVSEDHFFSYQETPRRHEQIARRLSAELLGAEAPSYAIGRLDHPELPPILAMSRADRIKNVPGLVELYGKSESLRARANLVIITSLIDSSQSADTEEIDQIDHLHRLIREYDLEGSIRWAGLRLTKQETGELYRVIADHRGAFAQPALMETFGLTVLEAMQCGVPVVVTCFGGPAEIVIDGKSGQVVNPNDHEAFAAALEKAVVSPDQWEAFSENGMRRVEEAFTWRAHAAKVLRLANVYGFWNYLDVMNRSALDQYIETLYFSILKPRMDVLRP
jgi:sucrose synthase